MKTKRSGAGPRPRTGQGRDPEAARRRAEARRENAVTPRVRRPEEWPSRREFLTRAGVTGALTIATTYLWLAPEEWPLSLADPTGERGKPKRALFRLPSFRVDPPPGASALGIAHGKNHRAMLEMAIGAIGGITHFIRKGDVVLIKPNVAFDRPPQLGATTNPDVLRALVELVILAGAAEIRIADNPIESPESCFYKSGIQRVAQETGAKLHLPSPSAFEMLEVPGARLIERWPFFYAPFRGVDKVIGIAPVKDHNLCHASMTTKNWYGLLGGRRNQFHQDIHDIVADLGLMMSPTFVILDASRVLIRNGPTGGDLSDVVEGRTIVAATDSITADAFGYSEILKRRGTPLRYLEYAAERKIGNPDWRNVPIREEQVG